MNIDDEYESQEDEDSVVVYEVPRKRAASGHAVRELLSEISELIYLVDDQPDVLAEVYNQLLRPRQKMISSLEGKVISLGQLKATESNEESNLDIRTLEGQKRAQRYLRSADERSQRNDRVSTVNIEESAMEECTMHSRTHLSYSDDGDMPFVSGDKVCWSNVNY